MGEHTDATDARLDDVLSALRRVPRESPAPRVNPELARLLLTGESSKAEERAAGVVESSRRGRGRAVSQRAALLSGTVALGVMLGVGSAAATVLGFDPAGVMSTPVGSLVHDAARTVGIDLPGSSSPAHHNATHDGPRSVPSSSAGP